MTSPPGGLAFSLMKPAGAGACATGPPPSRFPPPLSQPRSQSRARRCSLSPTVERIPLPVGCHGGVSGCDGCGETALVGRATRRPPPLPGSPSPAPLPPASSPTPPSPLPLPARRGPPIPTPVGTFGARTLQPLSSPLPSPQPPLPALFPGLGAGRPVPPPPPGRGEDMAAHRPVEWVQAVVNRFDEQVTGPRRREVGAGWGWGPSGRGGRKEPPPPPRPPRAPEERKGDPWGGLGGSAGTKGAAGSSGSLRSGAGEWASPLTSPRTLHPDDPSPSARQ